MSSSKIELIVIPVVLFLGILYHMVSVVRANRSEALALNFSLNNLQRIETAIEDRATEGSGKMPDAKDWADQIVAGQSCLLSGDFVTPFSYPGYGVFFNASFAGCDVSEIDANSVILFACGKGPWNASGTRETFSRLSSEGRAYIVTWKSEVYEYDSATQTARRLGGGATIKLDDLMWSAREKSADPVLDPMPK
jgi:hypothetical protein